MSGRYVEWRPSGALARVVDLFWYCDGYRVPHRAERRLPSNALQVVIDLANDCIPVWDRERPLIIDATPPALAVGLPRRFSVIDTRSLQCMVGVLFRPGCGRALFAMPLEELSDREVDLGLLWGERPVNEMRERLQAAPGARAKFVELELMLLARLRMDFEIHPVIPFVLRGLTADASPMKVRELAERTGFSNRRVTQIFQERVGLTPKLFGRIARMQKIVRQVKCAEKGIHWTDLAVMCGYYDQAHFAHEFREFSGFTPGEFVTRRRPWANHVAME